MKPNNLLLACLFLMGVIDVSAQGQPSKKPVVFSYNISLSDYSFAKNVKDSSFGNVIKQKDWLKPANKSVGLGISYWKGLTNHIDFSGTFTGTLSSFPAGFVKDDSIGGASITAQLDGILHFKLLEDQKLINPFLSAGVGTGYFSKKIAVYAPLGMGLQFHFASGTYMILQAQWRKALIAGINNDYTFYSLGFAQGKTQRQTNKAKSKKETAKIILPQKEIVKIDKDTDGDGIPDSKDNCPAEKGTLNGCPDKDGDGVADKDDKCPDVKGVARYEGCPVPDTDKDGINDEEDKCPREAGLASNNGCPVKDSDGDGVADINDKCPDVKGTVENEGCPLPIAEGGKIIEVTDKSVTYNVEFDFDRSNLLPNAYAVLKNIVSILKADNRLSITVTGHSDSLGTPTANMRISASRAKVVTDYFLSYNINSARIQSAYYGSQRPIDKEQQWRNRRVEITIYKK